MAFEVDWSEDAVSDFEQIIQYLEQHWSAEVAADFAIRVSEVITLLRQMPYIYPVVSKTRLVRRCVLTKQTMLFYRVREGRITLLSFFDSRQNPSAFED